MPTMINPLRYPGAKRALIDYVERLIVSNNLQGCRFYEPYAGSAAVGINLLQKELISSLVLCEKDVLISSLWLSVFFDTDNLCKLISDTPITIDTWRQLLPCRGLNASNNYTTLQLGFAGLFFNRTNFSGIINANPIGGINQTSDYKIDCRFNKKSIIDVIKKIANHRDKVEVWTDDALHFMRGQQIHFLREACFVYFDPPYYGKGEKIYRYYYHNYEHIQLCEYVSRLNHFDWLISYDDAPFICGLYGESGVQYRPFHLDYSCASKVRRQGKELLISNLPLPPFPISEAAML